MRVLCTAVLSPSHTREALRFARLLADAGHEVHIATEAHLGDIFLDRGFSATACLPDLLDDAMTAGRECEEAVERMQNGTASEESVAFVLAGPHLKGQYRALETVAQRFKPDVILRDGMDVSAVLVAERLGVPHLALPSGAKAYTDPAAVLPHLNRWRATAGLPQRTDPLSMMPYGHLDYLPPSFTFAPHLPTALTYRQPAFADPKAALQTSIADLPLDRPLVYAGIGWALPLFLPSPGGPPPPPGRPDPVAVLRAMVDGLAQVDCRAVVSTSGVPVPDLHPAPHVLVVDSVPQPLLLEEACLFVTHGGYNSVREAIRTGTPMAVLPQLADQPVNAARVAELGLGAEITDPTPAGVASVCRRLLDDTGVRRRARQARLACLALPPVETAVGDVENLVKRHHGPVGDG